MSEEKKVDRGTFNISEIAIKRPVSTIMLIFTMIVMGIISYGKLSVELFPNVSFPIVAITTNYQGASSQEVETLVSKPIEDAISSINGIEHIRSSSGSGFSSVIAEFKLGKEMKDAANEVREKVSMIRINLPEDIDEPIVTRVDPDASPIINYVIGGNYPIQKLTDFVRDRVKPQLEQVDGVAGIYISGGQEREVKVTIEPNLIKKYGISMAQIGERLRSENLNFPSGTIKTNNAEISLRTTSAFTTAEQVANTPIKIQGGKTLLLRDLGQVIDGIKDPLNKAWINGKPAIVMAIQKQSGTNTIKIVENLNKKFEKMKPLLPSGVQIAVSFDTSKFILESKEAAIDEMIVGAILAIIVVFLFLRTIGGTLIAALAIPTSIIATFSLMYAMNFSINMMTLMALSLVVGILVDDAVVDLENIYRRMELGESPYEAAIKATNEIGLAVVATTFSIVAVFVPVAFMSGLIGQFFQQFGLTVSFSVMVSLLVARTLTPTLSAYLLKPLKNHHPDEVKGLALNYQNLLAWALKHRLIVIIIAILFFAISIPISVLIPKGFVPQNDRDEFSIVVKMPSGSTLNQTSAILNEISRRVREDKIVKETLVTSGNSRGKPDTGSVGVTLFSKKEGRKETVFKIQERLQKKVLTIPGAIITFREMRAVDDGSGQYALNLSLRGDDLNELQKVADKVVQKLHTMSIVTTIDTSSGTPQSELHIKVDRNKAGELGISSSAISSTIRMATFGDVPSKIRLSSNDVDIRVRLTDSSRYDLNQLKALMITGSSGISAPLDSIAEVKFTQGPTTIERYDRQRQIMVYANIIPGASLSDITAPIEAQLKSMNLPATVKYSLQGDAERMIESFNSLLTALALAVVFIYIILASQFEHFIHPFTIMMALPLSFVGAFLGLFIANEELGMMSLIGVVMLMGLVTKNSILLVDYTITLRNQGYSRYDALLKAGPVRLRPIVMTTIAMIAGMTPVAMRLTPGSEGRAPMAVAVIGGLITSTLLSLVVIPVMYTIMDDLVSWFVGDKKPTEALKASLSENESHANEPITRN